MGLTQNIKFKYNNISEIESLLSDFEVSKKGKLLTIKEYNNKQMKFEIAIEPYGLYTHRSGDYYELLGLLIEKLTGKFGQIKVDDL